MRHSSTLRLLALAAAMAAALPAAARAQHSTISMSASDSASYIIPRRSESDGKPRLRTRDGNVVLVLSDTALVMQLTDAGMDNIFARDTATRTGMDAIFARMAKAGMQGVLDHGIAYRLSALRGARAEGSRLVLEDTTGKHVFEGTELNGMHPMEDFDPADAARFAKMLQRRIGTLMRD